MNNNWHWHLCAALLLDALHCAKIGQCNGFRHKFTRVTGPTKDNRAGRRERRERGKAKGEARDWLLSVGMPEEYPLNVENVCDTLGMPLTLIRAYARGLSG